MFVRKDDKAFLIITKTSKEKSPKNVRTSFNNFRKASQATMLVIYMKFSLYEINLTGPPFPTLVILLFAQVSFMRLDV